MSREKAVHEVVVRLLGAPVEMRYDASEVATILEKMCRKWRIENPFGKGAMQTRWRHNLTDADIIAFRLGVELEVIWVKEDEEGETQHRDKLLLRGDEILTQWDIDDGSTSQHSFAREELIGDSQLADEYRRQLLALAGWQEE